VTDVTPLPMPELPEVETIRRGIQPLEGANLVGVEVRETRLRQPVDRGALEDLLGRRIEKIGRRAKYLLIRMEGGGGMIVHLGMSGRLLLLDAGEPIAAHDHVSWWFQRDGIESELRFQDPRRFGLVAAAAGRPIDEHPLLARLGPEPLDDGFSVAHLRAEADGSRRPVKNALMDSGFVAGVGNIYASEALWRARVNPKTAAGRISARRWAAIRESVRDVLGEAIEAGGTTLSDFRGASGDPGYFQFDLHVYDRAGSACSRCGGTIRRIVQAGRATYYCAGCQR